MKMEMTQVVAPPQTVPLQVVVPPQVVFGSEPAEVTCGNCHNAVITTTIQQNGVCTYIALIILLLICWPLCWIPLVIGSCKDVQHVCPGCGAQLGVYKKV